MLAQTGTGFADRPSWWRSLRILIHLPSDCKHAVRCNYVHSEEFFQCVRLQGRLPAAITGPAAGTIALHAREICCRLHVFLRIPATQCTLPHSSPPLVACVGPLQCCSRPLRRVHGPAFVHSSRRGAETHSVRFSTECATRMCSSDTLASRPDREFRRQGSFAISNFYATRSLECHRKAKRARANQSIPKHRSYHGIHLFFFTYIKCLQVEHLVLIFNVPLRSRRDQFLVRDPRLLLHAMREPSEERAVQNQQILLQIVRV